MALFIALSHKAYNNKNSEIGMKPQNNANGEWLHTLNGKDSNEIKHSSNSIY